MSIARSDREGLRLHVVAADIIGHTFHVQFREHDYSIIAEGTKLWVFSQGLDEPVGFVRLSSDRGGAIWHGDECIADYLRGDDGQYQIVPIEQGFRQPDSAYQVDPLIHLLTYVPQTA